MILNRFGRMVGPVEMYLFDTDVITNIFKPSPSEMLIGKLSRLGQQDQYISTITIFEIVYGAAKSDRTDYHLRNLEEILLPSVNKYAKIDLDQIFHVVQTEISDLEEYIKALIVNTSLSQGI